MVFHYVVNADISFNEKSYENVVTLHAYVAASAITDFPYWASFAYVLDWEGLRQWRTWEGLLWAQLLVPVVTLLFKMGYLGGFFGKDKVSSDVEGGKGAPGRKGL